MSLLGAQVYANPSTPIWLSSGGGTIDGNLTITGTLKGDVVEGNIIDILDGAGNAGNVFLTAIGSGLSSELNIYSGSKVNFLQSIGTPNTTLTLSAPGANLDSLVVGGTIRGIGPVPTAISVTSATITQNAPDTTLTLTPAYPLVTGAEYDIQVTGYWSVAAGVTTPATADYAQVRVLVGSGTAPSFYDKIIEINTYPAFANNPWTSASFQPFQARARVKGANIANLTATAVFNGSGTYPGSAVGLNITTLDIVRVS